MLGVTAALGRVFNSQEDDQVYQGHPVVVLSYDYWRSRFVEDRQIIGKKILVNNYPMTIVGVSARGFAGLDPIITPQIRVPILMKPIMLPEWNWFQMDDRRARWVRRWPPPGTGLPTVVINSCEAHSTSRRPPPATPVCETTSPLR